MRVALSIEDDLRCRILIADDHEPLRNTLKALLEANPDWQVCAEATNGLEAVQKAAEFTPDLIILDLSMPVMDGLQAAREIFAASPQTPIILFTNHIVSALALDADKAGIRQILSKTSNGNELLNAVQSLLNERAQSDAATLPAAAADSANRENHANSLQKIDETPKNAGDTVFPK